MDLCWQSNVSAFYSFFFSFSFPFIFISWRLITLQYCSGFCHTLTRISHGFTCVPHPDPPSRLPPLSLLFNMLSRLVITFLPRSKHLLISWLQSPSAVILEPKKYSLTLFPLSSHGITRCYHLSFLNVKL